MRAIQIIKPRKIAMLDDAPKPKPVEGQVLVKCSHIALCGSNMGQYTGEGLWADIDFPNPVGWAGHENTGIIEESRCQGWEPGELVLAQPRAILALQNISCQNRRRSQDYRRTRPTSPASS
ncbi:MAG: alcohol dehydrogenase catalytic domain-containing protein [Planctomycetes bacterium]|nr:alcohol dehydrogenase catalytic domain-containing protein [Planctomycetota bacterium]